MADRGLRAYAVPSARAGRHPDPAARRDALAGLMTGGFLVAILAAVLAIVIAAPQYAEPAPAAVLDPSPSSEPAAEMADEPAGPERETPTSAPPSKLKGYRWPVRRGGQVAEYFGPSKRGGFEIDRTRITGSIVITFYEGARVKAAHAGTVVAAGTDWIGEVGYYEVGQEGWVEAVHRKFDRRAKRQARQSGGERQRFPQGVVIDDQNGYFSVYSELKNLRVDVGDEVRTGEVIGEMARAADGRQMMRYHLVRMDGPWITVHESDRQRGYPEFARERIDPLAVLDENAKRKPQLVGKRPKDPPRLSEY